MKKTLMALLFAVSAFSLYGDNWPDTIVNGQETNYASYQGVVALIMDTTTGTALCTATLIDPEVLLTAGHCVFNRDGTSASSPLVLDAVSNPSLITVRNGANIFSSSTIAQAIQIIKHPDWDGYFEAIGYTDDIALVKLNKRLTDLEIYGLRQEPISMEGDTGIIVGYGDTSSSADESGIHRRGTAKILSYFSGVTGKNIEVGSPSGACFGDSGGPFFTIQGGKTVVEGVASYVVGACSAEDGSHYMPVAAYREFIEDAFQSLTGHGLDLICGNGIRESGETCDKEFKRCSDIDSSYPSTKNAPCNDYCSGYDDSECSVCGDGIRSGSEICDGGSVDCSTLGSYEAGTNAPCNSDCSGYLTIVCNEVICGDGIKEGGEVCDKESRACNNFGDYPSWIWAPCQSDCMGFDTTYCWDAAKATCGNGMLEGLEECDDGNWSDNDDCSTSCKNTFCGDGVRNYLKEDCDYADPYVDYYGGSCSSDCKWVDENKTSGGGGGCSLSIL